jgi:hypothetical protein
MRKAASRADLVLHHPHCASIGVQDADSDSGGGSDSGSDSQQLVTRDGYRQPPLCWCIASLGLPGSHEVRDIQVACGKEIGEPVDRQADDGLW